MERKFKFSIGEFYHVYNRGNNKLIIFTNDADKRRFVKLLYVCNNTKPVVFKTIQGESLSKIKREKTIVNIGAYCLIPNHFHLLLHEKQENGISLFMSKVLTAYSMYFNKKYKRTGKLFEGPFRSSFIDRDEYLKYLFSYIHLNPVKFIDSKWKENGIKNIEKTIEYLNGYLYSSYLDYIEIEREEKNILNKNVFPEYFSEIKDFKNFINEWLSYNTLSKDSPWKN